MFQGIYQNFNAEWFEDIGTQIVTSYVIIVFMPIIEFFLLFTLRYFCRVYDQGKWFWPHWYPTQTKKKTILSYKALYEGPEFETQYQYAQLWILVVMAFVFGPLIPMMFIYCFIGLLVLSVTNHFRLAYSVRREPNYNQKLNRSLLMSLYIGPISYCLVANIVYSNDEIFKN